MLPDDYLNGLNVSRETQDKLKIYNDLLHKWQKAINIVSPSTVPNSWERHILDSVQLLPLLPQTGVLADLGCGGGFPGLVLAMLNPQLEVNLIESDERKCQFMRTVSRETQTSVNVHIKRIEACYDFVRPNIITARALASLDKLLDYVEPWAISNANLECFFLKGERAEEEVNMAHKKYDFKYSLEPSMTDINAKIVMIKGIKRL